MSLLMENGVMIALFQYGLKTEYSEYEKKYLKYSKNKFLIICLKNKNDYDQFLKCDLKC